MRFDAVGPLDGERLDRAVATVTGCSRSAAAELVASGAVTVGGEVVTVRSTRLSSGVVVEVDAAALDVDDRPRPDPSVRVPVVHADEHLLVVDKPAGLVVHPGSGNTTGTMVHGLLARYPELEGVGEAHRPGIVHRLDKGTSGLLLVARTNEAHEQLVADLAARRIERVYTALVWGAVADAEGIVDAPIGRSLHDPTRMTVTERGRPARTSYRRERVVGDGMATLVRCRLDTGRTHQIRVHLAAIDHPVVGDAGYHGHRPGVRLDRPFLHAARLVLTHPVTGVPLEFTSELPADLVAELGRFERGEVATDRTG